MTMERLRTALIEFVERVDIDEGRRTAWRTRLADQKAWRRQVRRDPDFAALCEALMARIGERPVGSVRGLRASRPAR